MKPKRRKLDDAKLKGIGSHFKEPPMPTQLELVPVSPERPDSGSGGASEPANKFPLVRTWNLFSYILGKETRERVYEPLYYEFHRDYLLARRNYKTKWAKRWLNFALICRTAAMMCGCFRVMISGKITGMLWAIISPSAKAFIQKIFTRLG
jgi:hypothetical protein